MAPTTGRPPKTVDDYMALPDDVRAKLISGELYATPSPTPRHQSVVQGLFLALGPPAKAEGDRIATLGVYERARVPEYWLVDPVARSVEIHLLDGDAYRPDGCFVGGRVVSSPLLPGIEVAVEHIFG